jgi:hypothetical protein
MPLPGLPPTAPQASLSPDGRRLAFVTADAKGLRRLWSRSLDSSRPRPIEVEWDNVEGTEPTERPAASRRRERES